MKYTTDMMERDQAPAEKLRAEINKYIYKQGFAPKVSELSAILEVSESAVAAGLKELSDSKAIVLHPNSLDIWVAHPYALFPTLFWVETGDRKWWCNCIWCALGAASLSSDPSDIHTLIGGERKHITINIERGRPLQPDLLVHFPLPMKQIWDNVIFTCANTLVFEQQDQVDEWCKRHNMKKGEVVPLDKAWEFSRLWYGYYLNDDWKRKTPTFTRSIFEAVGFTGSFWNI